MFVVSTILNGLAVTEAAVPRFQIIPGLQDVFDISSDGSVVVGLTEESQGTEAVRWTAEGGSLGLGNIVGYPHFDTIAFGVSGDGRVVVGQDNSSPVPSTQAFRWESGQGMVNLGGLPEDSAFGYGFALDASLTGSVVVGGSGAGAFRWTAGDGMVGLGVSTSLSSSAASCVSADGSIIAGYVFSGSSTSEVFRWELGKGATFLGDVPGGPLTSVARRMSPDGSTIVGRGASALGTEAFRWTVAEGMVGLGDLPGGGYSSEAWGVSADGSIVVGKAWSARGGEAFIWDAASGMRSLQDMLVNDAGLDLAGWTLTETRAISDDGRVIVGVGTDPDYMSQGVWIAIVPEPSTVVLLGMAAVGLLAYQWRRRRT